MQNKELDRLTQMYIRKLPFVKGLLMSELQEGVKIYEYIAEDLAFNTDKLDGTNNYINGLRAAMNSLYTDFKN